MLNKTIFNEYLNKLGNFNNFKVFVNNNIYSEKTQQQWWYTVKRAILFYLSQDIVGLNNCERYFINYILYNSDDEIINNKLHDSIISYMDLFSNMNEPNKNIFNEYKSDIDNFYNTLKNSDFLQKFKTYYDNIKVPNELDNIYKSLIKDTNLKHPDLIEIFATYFFRNSDTDTNTLDEYIQKINSDTRFDADAKTFIIVVYVIALNGINNIEEIKSILETKNINIEDNITQNFVIIFIIVIYYIF